MSWRDEAAVAVVTKSKRMALLRTLKIGPGSPLLDKMKKAGIVNRWDLENILSSPLELKRTKAFMECLAARLTTKTFYDLVNSSPLDAMKDDILAAYVSAGGDVAQLALENIRETFSASAAHPSRF